RASRVARRGSERLAPRPRGRTARAANSSPGRALQSALSPQRVIALRNRTQGGAGSVVAREHRLGEGTATGAPPSVTRVAVKPTPDRNSVAIEIRILRAVDEDIGRLTKNARDEIALSPEAVRGADLPQNRGREQQGVLERKDE